MGESNEVIITRVTLDVLKPLEVDLEELAFALAEISGVESVDITVTEVDARTATLKVTISGRGISLEDIEEAMKKHSAVIKSVDGLSVAKVGET